MHLTLVHSQPASPGLPEPEALTFALDEDELAVLWLSHGRAEHVVAGCVAAGATPAGARAVRTVAQGAQCLAGPGFSWREHADGSATLVSSRALARAVLRARLDDLCAAADAPPISPTQLDALLADSRGARQVQVRGGRAQRLRARRLTAAGPIIDQDWVAGRDGWHTDRRAP